MNDANLNKLEHNKLRNFLNFVKSRYKFRYNSVKNRVEYRQLGKISWSQVNELQLWYKINVHFGKPHYGVDYICNALGSPQLSKPYNPLKDWLEKLEISDKGLPFPLEQHDPIKQLCTFVHLKPKDSDEEDQKYKIQFCKALRLWFIRAVRCLYDPLFSAKQCLVLMGPQSIGKTPFLKALLPIHKQEFIKQNPSLHPYSKDSRIALATNFIVLFDEIDDYFKCKENRDNHKSFMTTTVVNERLPYARMESVRERICSFLSSCNESHFLNDPAGTDRWIVFEVDGFINTQENSNKFIIQDFPIEQCWKWAYDAYRKGATGEYTLSELKANELTNESFKYNSDEFEVLQEYLEPGKKGSDEFMTSTQICDYLNKQKIHVKFLAIPLGKALRRLKFEQVQERKGPRVIRGYFVKKIEP